MKAKKLSEIMSPAQDHKLDKRAGVKEGSALDKRLDKAAGLPGYVKGTGVHSQADNKTDNVPIASFAKGSGAHPGFKGAEDSIMSKEGL